MTGGPDIFDVDRAGRALRADNPVRLYVPPRGLDCIADVPAEVLAALVEHYQGQEPPDTAPEVARAIAADEATRGLPRGLIDFSTSPHGGALKLLPEWQRQGLMTATTVFVHTIVGSGLGAWFYFRDKTGIESHLISLKSGFLWQLMSCNRRADAQLNGNAFAISIEHEDNGRPESDPLTQAQIESDLWLLEYLVAAGYPIPRRRVTSCAGGGLAYHVIMGAPSCFTPVAKSCPAGPRIRQFDTVLLPAFVAGQPRPPREWWLVPEIPKTNLDQIEGAAVDALQGSQGKAAIAAAVAEALAASPPPLGLAFVRQEDGAPVYAVTAAGQLRHRDSIEMLTAYAGAGARAKVRVLPADAPIWQLPINGPAPRTSRGGLNLDELE